MGIGPFDTFSFPDVYVTTVNEPPRPTAAGSLRFPAFIGVANETIPTDNYEMIRGSSAMADNKIVNEDVSNQVTGENRVFQITMYPIVTGNGTGTVSTDPSTVSATINGDAAPVASVDGANGLVYLVNIPAAGDTVLITYYFKRKDTLISLEDLSDQIVDNVQTVFKVHNTPVVQGDNGGITTTDPTHIAVFVNNIRVTVTKLDGDSGMFTLATTPGLGKTMKVTYYTNTWQDTYDILPSSYIIDVRKVGYAPGSSDFVEGVDFVLDTTGTFTTINWGNSFKVASGVHNISSSNYFGSTQITGTMYDNSVYRRKATGLSDGTNRIFTLEAPAYTGQGIGRLTDNPSKVTAYYGMSPTDASSIHAVEVNSNNSTIELSSPVPLGANVYVDEYVNMLPDDTWTLTSVIAGATGVGEYSIAGANTGAAMGVTWSVSDTTVADTDFGTENVTYPTGTGSGNCDGQVIPGYAVAETVSLTFHDSTSYLVTSSVASGTGSAGDNTGYLNQTYIDKKTGFRVTVKKGTLVTYAMNDVIGYKVSPIFVTSAVPTRAIPGLKTTVTNTTGVQPPDTAVINTYNKSGVEPAIGDFYYVSYDEVKQFNSSGYIDAVLYTGEKAMLNDTGALTINNRVGLAGHIAFLNGAAALAVLQIKRDTGSLDASDSKYIAGIDYFNQPMLGGYRPSLMEPVTTSASVMAYLKNSNTIQSGIRYANERMSYFGFPINTTRTQAQLVAQSMNSELMIATYPDGAITTIPDANGNDVEYLVDGSMLAAALAGRDVSPAFDVAEPITRKPIVGFKRLYRRMDSVTSAMTANAGITLIEEQSANMIIKFGLTTDVSSVLTRTPSVIKIKQFVQKGTRSILQPFIGQKFLTSRTTEIENVLKSYFGSLLQAKIITGFQGIAAKPDPNDPTIVRVQGFYSPVLPLLWIVVQYNLRASV
jgi:hypothetical protein